MTGKYILEGREPKPKDSAEFLNKGEANLIQLKLDKLRYAAELRDIRFRILLLKLKEEENAR
ncbi:hypothetical protein LCGC14_1330880 [marine sediment metagenome]|uniref:Uncharacterized protein n=1 Tax=marine sediment metagenome TaxID=412755 RepID=A0A0F9L2N8_9ZZZZ